MEFRQPPWPLTLDDLELRSKSQDFAIKNSDFVGLHKISIADSYASMWTLMGLETLRYSSCSRNNNEFAACNQSIYKNRDNCRIERTTYLLV